MTQITLTIDVPRAMLQTAVRAPAKVDALFLVPKAASCEFRDAGTLEAATTSARGNLVS